MFIGDAVARFEKILASSPGPMHWDARDREAARALLGALAEERAKRERAEAELQRVTAERGQHDARALTAEIERDEARAELAKIRGER